MIVATVYAAKPGSLETGVCDPSNYGPQHVQAMQRQFQKHLPTPHTFVCLSDVLVPGVRCIPLRHDWGGWWAKIELFSRAVGPTLYCDLDNVLLGSVDGLVRTVLGQAIRPQFVMARDWDYDVPNSSLMYWADDYRWIYEAFRRNPEVNAENYLAMPLLGDQGYIASMLNSRGIIPAQWQRIMPRGFFASRWDCSNNTVGEAHMVLWHGNPKPWQLGDTPGDIARVKEKSYG
jgi:hypothetical protein